MEHSFVRIFDRVIDLDEIVGLHFHTNDKVKGYIEIYLVGGNIIKVKTNDFHDTKELQRLAKALATSPTRFDYDVIFSDESESAEAASAESK